tara:strand:- start:7297 stop:8241 length:945 start_codon:yes stop_codon:yes gene_type:complete
MSEPAARQEMRGLLNARTARARMPSRAPRRLNIGIARALPLWLRVLRGGVDDESIHATLVALARLSRKRTTHRLLRECIPRVGALLGARMGDALIVHRCCVILCNLSFSETREVAKIATTLMTATRRNSDAAPIVAVTLAAAYSAVIDPVTRVQICEFALVMLESFPMAKRASGVTLLRAVANVDDSDAVFKASNAFDRARAMWHHLPVGILWIRTVFLILSRRAHQDAPNVAVDDDAIEETEGGDQRCCICLDALANCSLSCNHRFCNSCVRAHVSVCITGNGSKCDCCSEGKIPTCPLCRSTMQSEEILDCI